MDQHHFEYFVQGWLIVEHLLTEIRDLLKPECDMLTLHFASSGMEWLVSRSAIAALYPHAKGCIVQVKNGPPDEQDVTVSETYEQMRALLLGEGPTDAR